MSDRTRRRTGRRVILTTVVIACGLLFVSGCGSQADPDALATQSKTTPQIRTPTNTSPPRRPQGITNGTGGGLFSPYPDICRAQVLSTGDTGGPEPRARAPCRAAPRLHLLSARLQPRALAEPARGRVQRPSGSLGGVRCGLGPVGTGHTRRSGADTLGPGLGRLAPRPPALRSRTCAENGLRTDTPPPAGRSPAAGHSQDEPAATWPSWQASGILLVQAAGRGWTTARA